MLLACGAGKGLTVRAEEAKWLNHTVLSHSPACLLACLPCDNAGGGLCRLPVEISLSR